jgi:hypothetical protein
MEWKIGDPTRTSRSMSSDRLLANTWSPWIFKKSKHFFLNINSMVLQIIRREHHLDFY